MNGSTVSTETLDALRDSRALYKALSDALRRALEHLQAAQSPDPKSAAAVSEAVKAHAKALQTLIESDARLSASAAGAAQPAVLDLAAARAEIARRLARLRAEDRPQAEPGGEAVSQS